MLIDHLEKVSKLAKEFATKLGFPLMGETSGLAHDLGKFAEEVQDVLNGMKSLVDHSTAGARELSELYKGAIGRILAYTVAGHHAGLPNGDDITESSLEYRLTKKIIADYSDFNSEIKFEKLPLYKEIKKPPHPSMTAFTLAFQIRMLFSCVIDADSLKTEEFYSLNKKVIRESIASIDDVFSTYSIKVQELLESKSTKSINKIRNDILLQCIDNAKQKPGFFSLSVPTGGGKTYSSMAFATIHAKENKLERIIYAIPYTSIIEQTAKVLRECLPPNSVLEHHMNFEYPDKNFEDMDNPLKTNMLVSENWDMPVVVSTAVQFFESLFASSRSKCQKLHNIANSIIIIDEAQMIPIEYLKPCMWALTELVENYNCTVLFCTATQPLLERFIPTKKPIQEIINDPLKLYNSLKRVNMKFVGFKSNINVINIMKESNQALCIVNTKKHATMLYELLITMVDKDSAFHLSTKMCAKHRSEVLKKIKYRLKNNLACYVISTSLIEAGVNIDFPAVLRATTGVPSLAQSCGRENREDKLGKLSIGIWFIPEDIGMPTKGRFRQCADMAERIVKSIPDIISLDANKQYFDELYLLEKDNFDSKNIIKQTNGCLDNPYTLSIPFKDISNSFIFIEDESIPVIINYHGMITDTIEKLKCMGDVDKTLIKSSSRKFQIYSIGIQYSHFESLKLQGKIEKIANTFWVIKDTCIYSEDTGIIL